MACDICGKTGVYLNDLLGIYQTDEVKSICSDCEKVVNVQLRKIQKMTLKMHIHLLKRFILELRAPTKCECGCAAAIRERGTTK